MATASFLFFCLFLQLSIISPPEELDATKMEELSEWQVCTTLKLVKKVVATITKKLHLLFRFLPHP